MTADVEPPAQRHLDPPPPPPAMAPPDPDWVGGVEFDLGSHRVGVQADSTEVLELVQHVFHRWVVGDGEPRSDFGISVERRGGAGPRLMPQLLHGRANVLRSRSLPRLLRRLDIALGDLAFPADGTAIGMAAFVRAGRAVLVPTSVAERSTGVERAVATARATIAEQAALRIDLDTQELVVVPGLTDPRPVPQLVDDLGTAPGRYALRAIVWAEEQLVADERPAAAVARLAEHVDLRDVDDRQAALEHIAGLQDRFTSSAIPRRGADVTAALAWLDGT